jgi:leader peptidase (prepilin peptidase)/N-methyltransferase
MTATAGTLAAASVGLTTLMWVIARILAGPPRPGWIGPRIMPRPWLRPVVLLLPAVPVFLLVDRGFTPAEVPALLLLVFGVPASVTDARELRLPNELTYGLAGTAAVAVGLLTAFGVPGSAVRAVLCGVGYAGVLLAIAVFAPTGRPLGAEAGTVSAPAATALGLGDIKLAAGLGIVVGWTSFTALTAALAFTAVTHVLWSLGCTVARKTGHTSGMSGTALGPWMVLGAMLALYLASTPH